MVQRTILSMERSLTSALPVRTCRPGLALQTWQPACARAVHDLLRDAYRSGGGHVGADFARWQRDFTGDVEFDPSSCFLAIGTDGVLQGVALCWDSAFVKDLCVAAPFRRRGVGATLLVEAMHHFAARGMATLRLKAESDNPSGAVRLYERLGFRCQMPSW